MNQYGNVCEFQAVAMPSGKALGPSHIAEYFAKKDIERAVSKGQMPEGTIQVRIEKIMGDGSRVHRLVEGVV